MGYQEEMMPPKGDKQASPKTVQPPREEGGRRPIGAPSAQGLENLCRASEKLRRVRKEADNEPDAKGKEPPPEPTPHGDKQERRMLPSLTPTQVVGTVLGVAAVAGSALVIAATAPAWFPAAAAAGAFFCIFGGVGKSKDGTTKNSA